MPSPLDLIDEAFARFVVSQAPQPQAVQQTPQGSQPNGSYVPDLLGHPVTPPIGQPTQLPAPQTAPPTVPTTQQQPPTATQPSGPSAIPAFAPNLQAASQAIVAQLQAAPGLMPLAQQAFSNPNVQGMYQEMGPQNFAQWQGAPRGLNEVLDRLRGVEPSQAAAIIRGLFGANIPTGRIARA